MSAEPTFGVVPRTFSFDRLSLELTNACDKACPFCYNHSQPEGDTLWSPDEVVALVEDCADHGVAAVSFGGGEPLQYPALFDVLCRLDGKVFRSFTTSGLRLDEHLDDIVASRPDKVHVSLHFPGHRPERERVIRQVIELAERGVRSGVNLLVRQSQLAEASEASRELQAAGIGLERIMFLPMRGADTPSPREMAQVAGSTGPGSKGFQSMTCLLGCAASPRFASLDWARRVAWCSYTESRRELPSLDFAGVVSALDGLGLRFCG